ncbi:MAG: Eco57I restriction-modification methylase domain-containing protein [Phycisphaerales bacterium]|nr:Eco57I restriction-modification methylase domain-containing protein [Phycisphaerales bacterium]
MDSVKHNPDILTCLANLSADEVFTPPKLATAVLDLLPPELFRRPNATFLDPVCKSGVFLREIARRLNEGLRDQLPDDQARIDHILMKQVFGLAITELTALLSRRSVYCSKKADGRFSIATKFERAEGNIRLPLSKHDWNANGRCNACGASRSEYDRDDALEAYAYPFVHGVDPQEIFGMKFDVIVGNPPYQMSDGGGTGSSARPLYHTFVEQAKKLEPRFLAMIVPSRWFTGGKGLDNFRKEMLGDDRIRKIVDYADSRECFPGVDIAGGVNYFLWERDRRGPCEVTSIAGPRREVSIRQLDELDAFVRDATTLSVVKKTRATHRSFLSSLCSARKPFGLDSKARPTHEGDLTLVSSESTGAFPSSRVTAGTELIHRWKVFVSKASSDHGGQADKSGKRKVFARVMTAAPGVVCSESYLAIGPFDSEQEATNTVSFLTTRVVRYLVAATLYTQNITRERFGFVPNLPMFRRWTDPDLYKELNLDETEISHVEATIRPWGEVE